jgi:hypothetical protein
LDTPAPTDPFTAALEAFDPEAEPYASMSPGQLFDYRAVRLKERDMLGFWTAELHAAHKQRPRQRLIGLTQTTTQAYLLDLERDGLVPAGWTHRHLCALFVRVARSLVLSYGEDEPGGLTMAETVDEAHRLARGFAADAASDRARVERYASDHQLPMGDHPATLN